MSDDPLCVLSLDDPFRGGFVTTLQLLFDRPELRLSDLDSLASNMVATLGLGTWSVAWLPVRRYEAAGPPPSKKRPSIGLQ